jgi:hypothetical protein
VPPGTSKLVQQLSWLAPQFVRPGPLAAFFDGPAVDAAMDAGADVHTVVEAADAGGHDGHVDVEAAVEAGFEDVRVLPEAPTP